MIRFQTLGDRLQTELVEATEYAKIKVDDGSVTHIEVFRLGCERTPIIERPPPNS